MLDTHAANSKYYNPYTFDPQLMDYQKDIRLSTVREELPDNIDSSDVAEATYANLFLTELTWPSLFFGAWAAWEPDVFHIDNFNNLIAHYSLSMGKRSIITNV